MAYRHGIYIQESATPLTPPVQVDASLPMAIGVAPVHRLEDPASAVNVPIILYSYSEGVEQIGYSDNWQPFTLSEMLYSQFRIHCVSPLVVVNVWNPLKNAEDAISIDQPIINGVATIDDGMAMISTVEVVDGDGEACVRDTDYTLAYDDESLLITVISSGKLAAATTLTVSYKKADASGVTVKDIVGGTDSATNARTGIELADEVFLRWQKNLGFLLAPGWSDKPEVAAMLIAKAKNLNNGNFSCLAYLDLPTDADHARYSDIPEWKTNNGYIDPYAAADWPCIAIDDRVFHPSARLVGLHGEIDADNGGRPYVSASNHTLSMTKTCLADGTEVPMLDQGQANLLNENGIGTFLNWGGWRAWGNETTAYPSNTDVKDCERYIRRMFCYIQNTVNRTIWQKVDAPINRILIDGVILTINQWFNTLAAEGAILGGRVEFLEDDNNASSLMGGRVFFRVYITPPAAAKDITFDFQYDPDYLSTLFS